MDRVVRKSGMGVMTRPARSSLGARGEDMQAVQETSDDRSK